MGGKSKTYDITVDLDRLLAYGLTLKQVLDGLANATSCRRQYVNLGPQSPWCAASGNPLDGGIGHTMLAVRDGAPILVSDVARSRRIRAPARVAGHDERRHRTRYRSDAARRGDVADPERCWPRSAHQPVQSAAAGVRIEASTTAVLVDVTPRRCCTHVLASASSHHPVDFLGDLRSAIIVARPFPSLCCSRLSFW